MADQDISAAEKKVNQLINKQLKAEEEEMRKNPVSKLLLLGPGDSGKTTVLKQMRILHGDGFSATDRVEFQGKVVVNIISSIKAIVSASQALNIALSSQENEVYAKTVSELDADSIKLSPNLVTAISSLWKDSGIQQCYSRSNEYIIQDTAKYFLDNAAKLSDPSYTPTDFDILLTRSRTLKVSETDFTIKSRIFRVIDVAGQRSARPAWAIFFDDARAILFVVSLASYDQFMEEDSSTNKMEDALNLFELTCNNPILKNVAMILLLNKTDLMEAKIKTSSIKKYFPDLEASKNETELKVAKTFFRTKFEGLNKTPKKYVYTHFTNSTDTTLMEVIIDACVDIIVRLMLDSAGMM